MNRCIESVKNNIALFLHIAEIEGSRLTTWDQRIKCNIPCAQSFTFVMNFTQKSQQTTTHFLSKARGSVVFFPIRQSLKLLVLMLLGG